MSTASSGVGRGEGERLRVECGSCGAAFKVAAANAGKRGKCPQCGAAITVPVAPAAAADEYDPYELDTLPDATSRAPAHPSAPVPVPYVSPPSINDKWQQAAAAEQPGKGRFVIGLLVAGAFAVACMVVWVAIAYFTNREFGILAWAMGAAVGAGMLLGYGRRSPGAGFAASAIAVVAILLPKLAVAGLIAAAGAMATYAGGVINTPYDPATARMELAAMMIDDVLLEQGKDYNLTSIEEDQAAEIEAGRRLGDLPDAEVELAWKRQKVADLKAYEQEMATDPMAEEAVLYVDYADLQSQTKDLSLAQADAFLSAWQPPADAGMNVGFGEAFMEMMRPMDALWILFALISSYKIAGAE